MQNLKVFDLFTLHHIENRTFKPKEILNSAGSLIITRPETTLSAITNFGAITSNLFQTCILLGTTLPPLLNVDMNIFLIAVWVSK